MPEVVIIGGPNGAGKSTLARLALPEGMVFVNADEIAKTLPADFDGNRDLEAGRLLTNRVRDLSATGTSFAIETTLASRSLASRIRTLRVSGWVFRLIFIWVPDVELSIQRVAERVRRGGHNIPQETIRRRYTAGLKNLRDIYLPMADRWFVYQNAGSEGPLLVSKGGIDQEIRVLEAETWSIINEKLKP